MWFEGFLGASWWQGIAGVAQILAAVLSIIAIWQAQRSIRQAQKQLWESTSPDWDLVSYGIQEKTSMPKSADFLLVVKNSGFGPARDTQWQYKHDTRWVPTRKAFRMVGIRLLTAVLPGEELTLNFPMDEDTDLGGWVVIRCASRYGRDLTRKFYVQAGLEEGGSWHEWAGYHEPRWFKRKTKPLWRRVQALPGVICRSIRRPRRRARPALGGANLCVQVAQVVRALVGTSTESREGEMTRMSRLITSVVIAILATGIFISVLTAWVYDDCSGLLLNLGTEMVGAAVIYFVLERVLEPAERREARKRELIAQLGSTVPGRAIAAAEDLARQGWLTDGSLSAVSLSGANLQDANLILANLCRATLKRANLKGANLGGANLEGAILRGANLRGAYLGFARLQGADLHRANLRDADLGGARYNDDTRWPERFTPPPEAVKVEE